MNHYLRIENSLLSALNKIGFDINSRKNIAFLNDVFMYILKDKQGEKYFDRKVLQNKIRKHKVLNKAKVIKQPKPYMKDEISNFFTENFLNVFDMFYNDDALTTKYISVLKTIYVKSMEAVEIVLRDKFNVTKTPIGFQNMFDFCQSTFVPFEKIGKFTQFEDFYMEVPFENFDENIYKEYDHILDISFVPVLGYMNIHLKVKPNVMMVVNSTLKVSKHIKAAVDLTKYKLPV